MAFDSELAMLVKAFVGGDLTAFDPLYDHLLENNDPRFNQVNDWFGKLVDGVRRSGRHDTDFSYFRTLFAREILTNGSEGSMGAMIERRFAEIEKQQEKQEQERQERKELQSRMRNRLQELIDQGIDNALRISTLQQEFPSLFPEVHYLNALSWGEDSEDFPHMEAMGDSGEEDAS